MTPNERFTVEERAERWQRRMTGPWRTAMHEVGPVDVSYRYRRRPRIEWVRLWVAWHDLWTHAIVRRGLFPILRTLAKRLP